jgi:hypothetical protein
MKARGTAGISPDLYLQEASTEKAKQTPKRIVGNLMQKKGKGT